MTQLSVLYFWGNGFHGFPQQIIKWIKTCVFTPSLSVVIDGGLDGTSKGKGGWGHEIQSPKFLFPLVMEEVLFFPILQHKIKGKFS